MAKGSKHFIKNAIVTHTYKQQAYNHIKEAILYRRLKTDTIYSQDSICNELGISRTPVREAMLELQKEGYVSILRGKGIKVVSLSEKDAEEIIEMREIIELAGSRLAALRATSEQLRSILEQIEEMQRNIKKYDNIILYKLDRKFHNAIFKAAGNNYLLEMIENLRDQFLRIETLTAFTTDERISQVLNEHIDIYDAIVSHDAEKAYYAMKKHLSYTYERTIKIY